MNLPSGRSRMRERPQNVGSSILTDTENATLFSVLGHDCVSLSAGVVQLLRAEPHNPRCWFKAYAGVISLVKDYEKRGYFLRLFELYKKQSIWQQMLYKNFRAHVTSCANLITFEGDDCVFGLNFSSLDEARNFKHNLDMRYEQEQRSQQKENRIGGDGSHGLATGSVSASSVSRSNISKYAPASMSTHTGITDVGAVPYIGSRTANLSSAKNKKPKSKKSGKPKIRKEDISNPTNFQHKAHLGWDQECGFSQEVLDNDPMDESVKSILRAAGQNPDHMTKDDLDFSCRFISTYAKFEEPSNQQLQQTRRHNGPQQSSAVASATPARPLVPPVRRESTAAQAAVLPSQKQTSAVGQKPPARPLPQPPTWLANSSYRPNDIPPPPPLPQHEEREVTSHENVAPPPPPPPPPLPASLLPQPDRTISHAMQHPQTTSSTAEAVSNRTTDTNKEASEQSMMKSPAQIRRTDNVGSTVRDDVMAQIRQGASLKPVNKSAVESRKSVTNIADVGGIAGALARALEERRKNMRNSDDSDEEEEENNNSEWEED